MQIRTLWGQRKMAYDGQYAPELMVAWDEYTLDENWDGYEDEKAKAIESWGDDLVAARELVIEVDDDVIFGLFEVPVVQATASEVSD